MVCTTRNEKYAEIARKMRSIPLEQNGPCYEWEELVQMMCFSNDKGLQDVGKKEHEVLNHRNFKRNDT